MLAGGLLVKEEKQKLQDLVSQRPAEEAVGLKDPEGGRGGSRQRGVQF